MSTDAPRPERVTLTDDEMRVLHDQFAPASSGPGEWARLIAPAVESILAAREQALREEIAADIEGCLEFPDRPAEEQRSPMARAYKSAARIARGENWSTGWPRW